MTGVPEILDSSQLQDSIPSPPPESVSFPLPPPSLLSANAGRMVNAGRIANAGRMVVVVF